ncbi:methionyl-tRNA formyltransferase [Streptomyces lasalocidi]
MRVVLMSYGAEGFGDLQAACETAYHAPVAYVCAASQGGAAADEVLAAMPSGPDLLVPRSPQGLALSLAGYEPDIVVCYGIPWRLPASVLRVPRLGMLNVHPSMLPRHRGPMPVHWAVRHGDEETGVTVHWMDEAFDSGPVVAQRGGIALPDDLAGDVVFTQVRATIRALVPEALALAEDGFAGTPQDESLASYEGSMGPESSVIDWSHVYPGDPQPGAGLPFRAVPGAGAAGGSSGQVGQCAADQRQRGERCADAVRGRDAVGHRLGAGSGS